MTARCSAEVERDDDLFHPCSDGCYVLGCWYRRDDLSRVTPTEQPVAVVPETTT